MKKTINEVLDYFIKNTKYTKSDIADCNFYYDGYTNWSYKVILTNDDVFQVKITRNNQPTMINEIYVYEQYNNDNLVFADVNGNIIRRWIEGIHFDVKINTANRLHLLFKEIKTFHRIKPLSNLVTFDYYQYLKYCWCSPQYFKLYKTSLLKYHEENFVVSHNDVNSKNTILNISKTGKEIIKLIDFEWTTLNYQWFDQINLFCEDEIYDEKILSIVLEYIECTKSIIDLYHLMFIRWFFCLGWALKEKHHLPNMKQYIKKAKKNLTIIYNYIKNN